MEADKNDSCRCLLSVEEGQRYKFFFSKAHMAIHSLGHVLRYTAMERFDFMQFLAHRS